MENVVDLNFWSLLSSIDTAVRNSDMEACLDFVRMLELIDNRPNLDELGIIDEFKIVMLIDSSGIEGLKAWRKVVSHACWFRQYHYFLAVEVKKKRKGIIVSNSSVYVEGVWMDYEFKYDFETDLQAICAM